MIANTPKGIPVTIEGSGPDPSAIAMSEQVAAVFRQAGFDADATNAYMVAGAFHRVTLIARPQHTTWIIKPDGAP